MAGTVGHKCCLPRHIVARLSAILCTVNESDAARPRPSDGAAPRADTRRDNPRSRTRGLPLSGTRQGGDGRFCAQLRQNSSLMTPESENFRRNRRGSTGEESCLGRDDPPRPSEPRKGETMRSHPALGNPPASTTQRARNTARADSVLQRKPLRAAGPKDLGGVGDLDQRSAATAPHPVSVIPVNRTGRDRRAPAASPLVGVDCAHR